MPSVLYSDDRILEPDSFVVRGPGHAAHGMCSAIRAASAPVQHHPVLSVLARRHEIITMTAPLPSSSTSLASMTNTIARGRDEQLAGRA